MLLGDLIGRFEDEAIAATALLSLNDLALTAQVLEAAAREDMSPGEFASAAVQNFSASAGDEDWVTALGQMSRTDDPGTELLRRALKWALMPAPTGCSHGRT
ncbi:MAG: hypothetical protein AB7O50_15725 [Pseudolabrys sp.]